jgi:hypothetical protein
MSSPSQDQTAGDIMACMSGISDGLSAATGRARNIALSSLHPVGIAFRQAGFVNLTTQDELIGRVRVRHAAIPAVRRHAAKASPLGSR